MKPEALLRFYPSSWRQRYGEEIADLLASERMTPALAFDLLRGALDAHLHPQLVQPALAAAGVGAVGLTSRAPKTRAGALLLVLVLLLGWGLAQPIPVLPIFVPIGAHASPQAYAQSQEPTLPIRASVERDGIGAVFLTHSRRAPFWMLSNLDRIE